MKKTAAILLLGILLFNWVGYRFITAYLEDRSNQQFDARLDEDQYDQADLISIKVVNHLPYTNSKEFKRVNGQVEIAGIQYNYVKMRVSSDSIELLCIPNTDYTKMQSSKDEFFKLVNDLQHNGQDKKSDAHPGSAKNFSIDVYTVHDIFALQAPRMLISQGSYPDFAFVIPSCFAPTAEQPPERI